MLSNDKRRESYKEIGFYIDVGLRFALTIIVCLFLGLWIDNKTGLKPVFTMIGAFFGAGAGFYTLYKNLMLHSRKKDERKEI